MSSVAQAAQVNPTDQSDPPDLSDSSRRRWPTMVTCLVLTALTWIVFGQTLRHEFVNYDDGDYVYANPNVSEGLSAKGVLWAFTHVHSGNWHPITTLSHMLDCEWYGLNAGWHHLTNVLLHTATAILLFLMLRQLTGALWRGAFVAAVFTVHPLRVESVAWISERKDVLSGLFFVLTIWAYVKYVESKGEGRRAKGEAPLYLTPDTPHLTLSSSHPSPRAWYAIALVLFALGLMSKPMLVTLPFVLLLLDYWPLRRVPGAGCQVSGKDSSRRLLQLAVEKIPFAVLTLASCAATLIAQKGAMQSLQHISFSTRLANACVSIAAYLGQMIWPAKLAVLYPHPTNGVAVSAVALSLILIVVVSMAVYRLREHRYLVTGWLWYLIMLIPVIGLVQVGAQARADRYTYLPQIGLGLVLTWAISEWAAGRQYRRLLVGASSVAVLTALVLGAYHQTSFWRDSETLWTHTLACTDNNTVAHNNLGNALFQKGRLDEAIAQFKRVLQISPDDAEAFNSLGSAFLQKGQVQDAIAYHEKALELKPDYAVAHNNLGNALLRAGQPDDAIAHFQKAAELKPDNANAPNNLGNVFYQQGRMDDAIACYEKALRINGDDAVAQNNLGNALLHSGKMDEAIIHYRRALEIKPDYALACKNLGFALLQKGDASSAIAFYQKALQLKPDNAATHSDLADALLAQGSVAEAMAHYRQALAIRPDYPEVQNNLAWLLATAPHAAWRDGTNALALAKQAEQSTGGQHPIVLHTLAAAYAECGQFVEAKQSVSKAIELARTADQSGMVEQFSNELKAYEAGKPLHQQQP